MSYGIGAMLAYLDSVREGLCKNIRIYRDSGKFQKQKSFLVYEKNRKR